MSIKQILDVKGREVVTTTPDATIADAVGLLAQHKIGAVVVTGIDKRIVGILSERDVVRLLGAKGADALGLPVSSAMTSKVQSCNDTHSINQVMEIMTRGRFRHLPVETAGRIDGIISIGDVVKARIEDVEREAEEIRQYIATA